MFTAGMRKTVQNFINNPINMKLSTHTNAYAYRGTYMYVLLLYIY